MLDIVALITARGGSKGIPGKNIIPVAGKPLLAWTIEAARQAPSVRRVVLSTDDAKIAEVARDWHCEVPFLRPADLAQDTSSHLSVVLHALEYLEREEGKLPEYLLLLQPTSPMRSSGDIEAAIAVARSHDADSVVSVCSAHPHPWLAKQIVGDGSLRDFFTLDKSRYLRRQDLPPAYVLNGAIYLIRPSVLRDQQTFHPSRTFPYVMPGERSLDIDDPWDLHVIRLIMEDQRCGTKSESQAA
jgi:CMP-N-acetylneuraminic acid synthetase